MAEKELGVGPKCIKFIEDHGKRMKEALIAIGDEQEEKKEVPADSTTQATEKEQEVPVSSEKEDEMLTSLV